MLPGGAVLDRGHLRVGMARRADDHRLVVFHAAGQHRLSAGVVTEVDDHIRTGHGGGEVVAHIDGGENMQFRVAGSAGADHLSHAAAGAVDDDFEGFAHGLIWSLRSVGLRASRGWRRSFRRAAAARPAESQPRRASACVFGGHGIGFDEKIGLKSG